MKLSGQIQAPTAVPIEEEAAWDNKPACTCWRTENSPDPTGIRTTNHPASSLDTMRTMLTLCWSWSHISDMLTRFLSDNMIYQYWEQGKYSVV
jgi:hypothetical protein